jgi:hypothetical protein
MQAHHLATTRLVTEMSFVSRHGNEEWLAKQLREKQDIRENGVPFLGQRDFCTEEAALFHVKMGGGKTRMIHGVLLRGQRSLIPTHKQTLAANISSEIHKPKCRDEMDDPLECYIKLQLKHYINDFPTLDSMATMVAAY